MSFITGYRPAQVGEVTPYEMPIEDMATGVKIRQKRADDARNAMLSGDSALAIETRANQEDWDLAQEVRDEYKQNIDSLVEEAGGDWSKIDMSQIQAAAINKAQDNRVRQLTSALENEKAFLKKKRTIEEKHGKPFHTGMNPSTSPLYDKNHEPVNMRAWSLEEKLDHIAEADKMFSKVGHKLKEETGYNPMVDGDWHIYYERWKSSHKDNLGQINEVINGAIDDYIYTDAGNQYYRQLTGDFKNDGISDQEADRMARERIQELIEWTGESKTVIEDKIDVNRQFMNKPKPEKPSKPKSSRSWGGGGSNKKEDKPIIRKESDFYAVPGVQISEYNTPLEYSNSITSEDVIDTNLSGRDYNTINNINVMDDFATSVSNLEGSNNYQGRKYAGFLQVLDQDLSGDTYSGRQNRSIIQIAQDKDNRKFSSWLSNPVDIMTGESIDPSELTDEDIEEYVGEYGTYSLKEYKKAIKDMASYNSVEAAEKIKNLKSGEWTSIFVMESGGEIGAEEYNTVIDPVLYQLKESFQEKILSDDTSESNKKYYQAKLNNLNNRIKSAEDFLIDHKRDIQKFNSRKKMLSHKAFAAKQFDNIYQDNAGLTIEYKEALNAKPEANGDYMKTFMPKFNEAKDKAWRETFYNDGYNQAMDLIKGMGNHPDAKKAKNMVHTLTYNTMMNNLDLSDIARGAKDGWEKFKGLLGEPTEQSFRQKLDLKRLDKIISGDLTGQNEINNTQLAYYLMNQMDKSGLFQSEEDKSNNYLAKIANEYQWDSIGALTANFSNGKQVDKERAFKQKTNYQNNLNKNVKKIDKRVVNYFKLAEEGNEAFVREGNLYYIAKDSKGNDSQLTALQTVFLNAVTSQGNKSITKNVYEATGEYKQAEEFNHQLILDAAAYEAEINKTSVQEELRKMMKNGYQGVRADEASTNNPFLIRMSYTDKRDNKTYNLEIPWNPSEADLGVLGISAYHQKLYNDMNVGLQKNNFLYFDFTSDRGKVTRFYRAPTGGLKSHSIDEGEFFTIGNGDPENTFQEGLKPQRFSSEMDMMDYHAGRSGVNLDEIKKVSTWISLMQQYPNVDDFSAWGVPEGANIDKLKAYRGMLMSGGNSPTNPSNFNQGVGNLPQQNPIAGNPLVTFNNEDTIPTYTDPKKRNDNINTLANYSQYSQFFKKADNGNTIIDINNENLTPEVLNYLAINIRPDLRDKTYPDPNDPSQKYAVTKEQYDQLQDINLNDFSSFGQPVGSKVKHKYDPAIVGFMKELESLMKDETISKVAKNNPLLIAPVQTVSDNYRPEDLAILRESTDPFLITSGLRSLSDNMRAYRNRPSELTNSNHMKGKSIDIRTLDSSSGSGAGGRRLWKFLETESGKKLMAAYGLRVLRHNAGTGDHLDISVAQKESGIGTATWKRDKKDKTGEDSI